MIASISINPTQIRLRPIAALFTLNFTFELLWVSGASNDEPTCLNV